MKLFGKRVIEHRVDSTFRLGLERLTTSIFVFLALLVLAVILILFKQ